MTKIYAIGETVMDMIFSNNQPAAAKAGGSMLNTCVSLGRTKTPIYFISEFGSDKLGDLINDFLTENNVNCNYISRYSNGKTAIAIAFLDENKNANYDFYKQYPPERLATSPDSFSANDIFLFGSFYAISPEIAPQMRAIVNRAHGAGALMYYDPNYRKSHLHELAERMPTIVENMRAATLVHVSNDDCELIFGVDTADEAYEQIGRYCPNMLYTDSQKGVFVRTPTVSVHVAAEKINPVSTIGAGDTFNAGVIYALQKENYKKADIEMLSAAQWTAIATTAVRFATHVCLSLDNYISTKFANEIVAHV